MKRKRMVVLILLISILCTACGQKNTSSELPEDGNVSEQQYDTSTTPPEPSSSLPEKAILNCAWNDEPTSMNIMRYSGVVDLKLIWNLYEPLVRIADGKIVAAGAEQWSISEDGLAYTFNLRDNHWSDGQKVTAEDYVTMLRRAASPTSEFAYATDYYGIKNFESVNTNGADIATLGVHADSDNTLVIELEYPNNTFLSSIEIYPERIDIIEKYADQYGYSPETMIFCGPYKLTEWIHNSSIKLEKNQEYWDSQNVKIDEVNLKIIPDESTRLLSFQAGELDYVSVSDANYINEFRNNPDMYEELAQSARTYMFLFNCKDSILKNVKIRQALSLSISRGEISAVLDNGMTTPAFGLIPPATTVGEFDYRSEVEEPLIALSKSVPDLRALFIEGLNELGISSDPKNITLRLSTPSGGSSQEMAEYYKEMWQSKLGITVDIDMQEFATFRSLIWSDEYQIATTAWGGSIEPQFQLSRWLPDNQSQWDNDEYAALVNEGAHTSDDAARLECYAAAEKMLVAENAVIAPIKYDGYLVFYYNYIKGADSSPFSNVGFKSMYIEK